MNWIKETGDNYIAYSQGNYYKANNAVLWRQGIDEIILRNTYSGKEKTIWVDKAFRTNKKQVLEALNIAKSMVDKGIIGVI